MSPAQLLAHFERVSDTPDAIPLLRRFILDLAVRGTLVPQDPGDEPSSTLLELLRNESVIMAAAQPSQWQRARVGVVLDFQYGKALPTSERLEQGPVTVFGSNGVVAHCIHSLTEESAIIIGRKGSAGALNLCMGPSWTTDVAYFVVPPSFFNIRFLLISLQTLDLAMLAKGVKPGLSRSDAYDLVVLVPPLAEQQRIIAKVDELMALCDQLEVAQAERERKRDRLTAASLHRLNQPADAGDRATFREHARFHISHLSRFTTRPDQIPALRQTILSLAVLGRLVPQDTTDEPASELFKRIHAEKAQLLMSGELKSLKSPPAVVDGTLTIDWPQGWELQSLQSLCISVADGDHQPPPKTDRGIPFLVIGDIRWRSIDFNGCRHVTDEYFNSLDPVRRPRKGDILYTLVGSFGIPVIVSDDRPFCIQRHIGILRPSTNVSIGFLARVLESRFVFDQANACATGIAQKTVPLAGLRAFQIPLPPLREQVRIASKVEELMAVCDRLETQLTTTQTENRRLLDAVLHEALDSAA